MALVVESVILLLAIVMTIASGVKIAAPYSISPWLMPLLIGGVTGVVTAFVLVSDARQLVREKSARHMPVNDDNGGPGVARIAGWLFLTTAYAVATPIIGFEWATVAFLLIALPVFGRASWMITAGTAAAMAIALPLVFRQFFQAMIP